MLVYINNKTAGNLAAFFFNTSFKKMAEETTSATTNGASTATDARICIVCGETIGVKPYKTLLGGGLVCTPRCYQKHLGDPDDSDCEKSDLYW